MTLQSWETEDRGEKIKATLAKMLKNLQYKHGGTAIDSTNFKTEGLKLPAILP